MSAERHSPDDVDRVEPRVGDVLVGAGIGVLLIYVGMRISPGIARWSVIGVGVLFVAVMTGFIVVTLWASVAQRLRPLVKRAQGHTRRDTQLGTLTRNVKGRSWETTLTFGGRAIDLLIEGDEEPHRERLAEARILVADLSTLQGRLSAYLAQEAKEEAQEDPERAAEIAALRISGITLRSSNRPGHVLIDFKGPDEDVYWACDYIDGQPSGLWFD